MDCREAQKLVMPYIQDELTDRELEDFLEHIETCPACQEELEIYFMVSLGLKQLDEGTGSFNMKQEMAEALENSYRRVSFVRTLKIACYAVNTLAVVGVLTTFLIQIRIWFL